jgi:type II secretory pathway component PulF
MENGLIEGATLDGSATDLASKGLRVTQIGFHIPQTIPAASPDANPYSQPMPPRPVEVPSARFAPPTERSYVASSVVGPIIGKVPLENLAFFFRQAATMLKAGVGMVQSLNTLAGQSKNDRLSGILREVARNVEAGRPMTFVFQRYPEVFSPVIVSVIKAGEEGGFLDQSLATVADYIDQELELRNLYKRATFWPKVELAASVVVILAANAIIAGLNPSAKQIDAPLNHIAVWIVIVPIVVAIFLFFRVGLSNPQTRLQWDKFILCIPFLGNTLRQIAMARFGRSFAALYKAGVPLQRSLLLAADSCGNEDLRSKMYPAYRSLQEGGAITETLESTRAFSPIVMDMIRTGETTGNLDQMLVRSSDFYMEEAKVRQYQLGVVVGIFCLVVVAIYIGYVIVNAYMSMAGGVSEQISGAG